ncbi:MAG: cell division protein ZapE, partial [Ewingella sp.]|nr:cell division protein ZapE [Ewingella sp.]
MQPITPLTVYKNALSAGEFQPDDVQLAAVTRLDAIYHALNAQAGAAPVSPSARPGLLGRLFGKSVQKSPQRPAQGLYMW